MKLKDIGERRLIDSIFKNFNMKQEKDDCALIDMGEEYFMLSTDVVRGGTHVPEGANPRQIGRFAANVNLSDIAAMAGEPIGLLMSYLVEPEMEENYFRELVGGVSEAVKKQGTELLGGDTKEGNEIVLSGTAVGRQQKSLTRKRSQIKKGQVLGVTNKLGRAASGYVFYKSGYQKSRGIDLIMDITPRIKEAKAISEHGGKFMMDLSDGIYSSISQMQSDYGVSFRLVEDELPMDRNVKKASDISGASLTDIMCAFGGDYELLFTIDNDDFRDFSAAMESEKIPVSFIGDVWDGDNIMNNGSHWTKITNRGYEHFSSVPKLGKI